MPRKYVNQCLKLKCGRLIKNRIAKSAISEHLAGEDGLPNKMHCRLYEKWAGSGAGIILTGNIMLDKEDTEGRGNIVISSPACLNSLKCWVNAGGPDLWLQINHAGALSSSSKPLSPSGIAYSGKSRSFAKSYAMSLEDIDDLKDRYALASRLALNAGFAGIEIHAAHGFLLNQFLSSFTNLRSDNYGGSLENRMRLLVEVIGVVRKEVGGEYPIAVKINTREGLEGKCENERIELCRTLNAAGVDIIEISGGSYEYTLMLGQEKSDNYFLDFAKKAKLSGVRCPLMLTGGVRDARVMENIIKEGIADIIGLGRPMIIDPCLPSKILESSVETIPPQDADKYPVMRQLEWYWEKISSLAK